MLSLIVFILSWLVKNIHQKRVWIKPSTMFTSKTNTISYCRFSRLQIISFRNVNKHVSVYQKYNERSVAKISDIITFLFQNILLDNTTTLV